MATRTETAELRLDVDQFEKAAQSAAEEIQELGKWIKNTIIIAGTAKIAEKLGQGFDILQDRFTEVIKTGKEFAELGKAVGMAAGEYQKFEFAQRNGLSIADAEHILGDQVKAYNKSGEMFRTLALKLEEDKQKFQGLFVGFLSETSPAIIALLDALGHFDYEGIGEKIGRPIKEAASFITGLIANETIWELPGLLLGQGLAVATNYWINLAENIDRALKTTADAVPKILKAGFDGVIKPVALQLADALSSAALTGLPYLTAGLEFAWQETRNGLVDAFRYAIAFFQAGFKMAIQTALDGMVDKMPGMRTILGMAGTEVKVDSFHDQFQGALNGLNLDGLKTEAKSFGDILAASQAQLEGLKQRVSESLKSEGLDPAKAKEAAQGWLDALKKGVNFDPTDYMKADKFGDRIKQIIAEADAKGKQLTDQAQKNPYGNLFAMKGVFGEASSMASVGGGGGVSSGLMGVLDEARAQTNLQRQMVDLLAGRGGLTTGGLAPSTNLQIGY
jgi:hypothetical protein